MVFTSFNRRKVDWVVNQDHVDHGLAIVIVPIAQPKSDVLLLPVADAEEAMFEHNNGLFHKCKF